MNFVDLCRVVARRWYVAAPLFLVAAAVTMFAAVTGRPQYACTGYVQMVLPGIRPDIVPIPKAPHNPWLDLGPGPLAESILLDVSQGTEVQQLVDAGYTDTFTMKVSEQSPIIEIKATGSSAEQATGTVVEVARRLGEAALTRQRYYGVPVEQSITTVLLNPDDVAVPVRTKLARKLAVLAGMTVLAPTALAIAVDGLSYGGFGLWRRLGRTLRSRRRRDPKRDPSEDERSAPAGSTDRVGSPISG